MGRNLALTRHAGWLAILFGLSLLLPALRAQSDAAELAPPLWLDAATSADASRLSAVALGALPSRQRGVYLRAVGSAFRMLKPACLTGVDRRRCVEAHRDLALGCIDVEPALVEWFLVIAARYQAADFDCDGALGTLAVIDDRLPAANALLFERRLMRVDYLVHLNRLAAAERAAERFETVSLSALQRVRVLAQRGSVDVMLGRLDLASRSLTSAQVLLSGLDPDQAEVADVRFELLQRRWDLLAVREQFALVEAEVDAFARERAASGRELPALDRGVLDVYRTNAAYGATHLEPQRVLPTIASIEPLLAGGGLETRNVELLTIWLADLELRRDDFAAAGRALARLPSAAVSPRGRWLLAPIAAELARRRGDPPAELARHATGLRDTLHEMISAWREVAWDGESTGFLRLGTRLRVVGELIATTVAVDGPERALEDVLELQCCTSVSRSRGARPVSVAELRAQLLPPGHGALVYVPSWTGSHLFVVDRADLLHVTLPAVVRLRVGVAELQQQLLALDTGASPADVAAVRQPAEALAATLLPASVRPLVERWHHLTITGANLLGGLSFGCLPWGPDRLLGERFALVTTASLPLLIELRRTAPAAVRSGQFDVRLFATLQPAAGFARRNGVQASDRLDDLGWQRLVAQLPVRCEQRLGAAATVGAWLRSSRRRTGGLSMVFAHGEPPVDDQPPALGLAADRDYDDGLLTPAVIAATPQCGVIVLAACQAARGPARVGDDDVASSLAGAFLSAGATSVVASLASLRASLYLDLTSALLAELRDGRSLAEALRRARITAADGDAGRSLLLAQIECVGWDQVLVLPMRQAWWPWSVFGLGVLLLTLRGVWQRRREQLRSASGGRAAGAGAGAT